MQYYLIIIELMCDINNSFYDNISSLYFYVQLKYMIINQFQLNVYIIMDLKLFILNGKIFGGLIYLF